MPQAIPVGPLVIYLGDEPPGLSDDRATIGTRRGYWWVDRSASALWVCVDPAEGTAVWHRIGNAEDLAAIAWSGKWEDLQDTPDTLTGYGINDAATAEDLQAHEQATDNPHQVTAEQVGAPPLARAISAGAGLEGGGDLSEDRSFSLSAEVQASLALADTAIQPGDLGTAAYQDAGSFDVAGAAAAVASDLSDHEQDRNNPHAVTYDQIGADPAGAADAAEGNAKSYTDAAMSALGSAAAADAGTRPLGLPRNTELAAGAFAPHEPLSLWPFVPSGPGILTPDDGGRVVWSAAYDVSLPDSTAPGMQPGWRVWVKNTDAAASLTVDCAATDTLDGGASITLAAGASVLIVRRTSGEYGSL